MPSFKCKDMGMKCKFEVKTENQDELMQMIALHADKSHNMKNMPPEMMEKVKKAIKKQSGTKQTITAAAMKQGILSRNVLPVLIFVASSPDPTTKRA